MVVAAAAAVAALEAYWLMMSICTLMDQMLFPPCRHSMNNMQVLLRMGLAVNMTKLFISAIDFHTDERVSADSSTLDSRPFPAILLTQLISNLGSILL